MRPLFLHGHTRPLTMVKFNADGDLLFTAAKDARLKVWNADTGKRIGDYNCGKGVVWGFDVSADSVRLVAASADMKVLIFDVELGTVLHEIPESGPCRFVEWNRKPDCQNKFVVTHGSFGMQSQRCIKVWTLDGADGQPQRLWSTSDFDSGVLRVHWGPFDETIIACHESGAITVWCAETGELVLEDPALGHKSACTSCSFNEDRTLMLTCSSDQTAKLWDTVDWKERKSYTTDRPLNACDISPLHNKEGDAQRCHILLGGGQAAEDVTTTTASEGKFQALLYHMVFGDEIGSVKGHFGPVNTLSWMPDGTGFASGGEDGFTRIYKFDDDYFTEKYE
eukprot:GHVQ01034913.1.p1 GENE.GHVQ01034913.1~~GHVQ01034913.1.p1  ORF type:complete len:337 (+),score=51.14 GHVQ01034913.1:102-1112(+)